jgi:hypothetical protein
MSWEHEEMEVVIGDYYENWIHVTYNKGDFHVGLELTTWKTSLYSNFCGGRLPNWWSCV